MATQKTHSNSIFKFLMVLFLMVALVITPGSSRFTAEAANSGFYVSGTTIYDANGNPFEMRGVNIAHAWYPSYTKTSIEGAAALGANTVRIVLANGQQWNKTSYAEVSDIINWCKDNQLVCILEVHDATGSDSTSALNTAVNYWIEMKELLNANTEYVIVNVANEWYGSWNGSSWASGCQSAIRTLRNAGINNMLMIDSAGWGQYPDSIRDYGKQVFNADSHANTAFSIHMYEYAGGNASTVRNNIDNALGTGVPVVIGEFGGQHTNGDVDEYTIMSYCEEKGVGYLGWSWKGNNSDLSYLDIANTWDGSSLSEWGNTLFNDSYGIANTSNICTVFTDGEGSVVDPNVTTKPTPTLTPTPTPRPEGILHGGSVNITGTWWSEKQISMSDLIGDVDPAYVEKIVFTNDIGFIIGYNSADGYTQLSDKKEYTLTDVRFGSDYYFKICISNNDQKTHAVKWDVYGKGSAVVTPAPTAKPTATPTPKPTATPTPTPKPTATPVPTPGNDYYVKLEFEKENNFEQNGRNRVDASMFSGYSGDGYVYLETGWGEVGFTVPTAGKYRITLVTNADSYKENWLYLDDTGAGTLYTNGNDWGTFTEEYVLSAGTHKFGVSSHWGYTALDYVIVEAVN